MNHRLQPCPRRTARQRPTAIGWAVGLVLSMLTVCPAAQAQSRGELLYSTHCITCHTSEMHWREKRVATDFASLKFQVHRWQDAAGLGWSDNDVQDVARYLNESIYHYPPQGEPTAQTAPRVQAKNRSLTSP